MSILSLRRHSRGLGLSPRRREAKGTAPPGIVQDGLVAEWRFDEGSGQTLTDYSGNGHHGARGAGAAVESSDPTWTSQGLSFDGVDDFVNIADGAGISGGVPRSLLAVVKTGPASQFGCEWRGNPFNADFERWAVRRGTNGPNNVVRLEVQGFGYSSSMVVSQNTWIFVGATQSGSNVNTAVLYLNGNSENVVGSAICNTDGQLWFGSEQSLFVPMEAAYGLVYDRALSAAEVEQNRAALAAILAGRGITLP